MYGCFVVSLYVSLYGEQNEAKRFYNSGNAGRVSCDCDIGRSLDPRDIESENDSETGGVKPKVTLKLL
mgnify:CR=1 FL=1